MDAINRDNSANSEENSGLLGIPSRVLQLTLFLGWQVALLVALLTESQRIRTRLLTEGTPGNWWHSPTFDGTFFLPLLVFAPLCWCFICRCDGLQSERKSSRNRIRELLASFLSTDPPPAVRTRIWFAAVIAVLSGVISWRAGEVRIPEKESFVRVADALPLVQDELSYQLQARTLLAGRWSWPGPDRAAELFHQMHVLNEGQFASRYLPGTGAWIAPWLAIGHPVWGQWFAGMLTAVGFFLIGCELHGLFAGVVAGSFVALSPGLAIFNNLLLAHAPTLLGLVLFLFAFFKFMKVKASFWTALAGTGLAFAMLCRPLTAAAIGLPFGIWFCSNWIHSIRSFNRDDNAIQKSPDWFRAAIGLAVPLVIAFAVVGWQNRVLTANVFTTPYQLYMQTYTPRHVYGFHNGEPVSSSQEKVLHAYNDWAVDLDLNRALKNLENRIQGSFQWSLGIIPLTMTAVILIGTLPWQSRELQLILAAIVSLHLFHFPYWLDGMLQHHYVFESGPLWILLFAAISSQVLDFAIRKDRWLILVWWSALVGVSVSVNFVRFGEQGVSRLETGWKTFLQPTQGYRTFERILAESSLETPALILVRGSEEDLHAQYVRNRPPFDAEILIATDRPERYSQQQLETLFPERNLYRYDTHIRLFKKLAPARSRPAGTVE